MGTAAVAALAFLSGVVVGVLWLLVGAVFVFSNDPADAAADDAEADQ